MSSDAPEKPRRPEDERPEASHGGDRDEGARSASAAETVGIPAPCDGDKPDDLVPGYRFLRSLSAGGQGVVYEAVQTSTGRKVAVKMMRAGTFAGRSDRSRFEREVKVLARLKHPNIVAILDSGTAPAGHYLVMDYIAGRALDEYMRSADAPRSIREILRLFEKITGAVNAAHLAGIIHRDLKPSNIRIDGAGQPHILDFGLAKVPLTDSEASMMTMTGQFVGSLPYASPEQAEGQPDRIDVRTDVYSLGVMLYQMLTGSFPYEVTGNMRDVLDRILRAEPRAPSTLRRQINDEVETIVLKCLNKERERRYQSAGELNRDLQRYLAGEPIEAKRDSFGYVMRKQLARRKVPVAVGLGFAVVILAGLVVSLALWRRAAAERETAEFYLEAARAEVTRSFDEYQELLPRLRRAEEIAARVPRQIHRLYPQGSPEATYRDATQWITRLFPPTEDEASVTGTEPLDPAIRDALQTCARQPYRPLDPAVPAWVEQNRDRIEELVDATRRHRYGLGPTTDSGLLVGMLLPSMRGPRLAAELLTASALVRRRDGYHEEAVEHLRAAMRISRYVGDGPTTIGTLVEIRCRDIVHSAYRWIVIREAGNGALPSPYLSFFQEVPPLPTFAYAQVGEFRVLRQTLNEAFARTSSRAPSRIDLERLREIANEWGLDRNPYSDPSEAMRADAARLGHEEAVSIIGGFCKRLVDQEQATFREIRAEGERVARDVIEAHPVLDPLLPNFTRALELRREAQMNWDATVIAVAIAAFRDSTGQWPESIDAALASFDVKPICRSYYGHDFVYRIEDDAPLLYTVGPNETDDGGHGPRYEARSKDEVEPGGDDVLFLAGGG